MSHAARPGRARRSLALTAAWLCCFALALASGGIFVSGVRRDTRPGGVELPVDLGVASGWLQGTFEAGTEPHLVHLTTVNHDPGPVGAQLDAALEVRLAAPDGRIAFAFAHPPDPLAHAMPDNMAWTELARLDSLAPGRWTLSARVLRCDPRFAGKLSRVLVRPLRPDAGMGGLASYVMMIPGIGFGAVAWALGLALAMRGRPIPLVLTTAAPLLAWVWLRL